MLRTQMKLQTVSVIISLNKQTSDNIPTSKFKFNEYMKQNPLNITNSIFFSFMLSSQYIFGRGHYAI